jgi:hypothetical protein
VFWPWFHWDVTGRLVAVAALILMACGSTAPLEGDWQGTGSNRLALHDGRWSLRTGTVEWSGRYQVEGDHLLLETERVVPSEGHETDCDEAPEPYEWRVEEDRLVLRLAGSEPCNQNRRAVLQTSTWTRV